MTTTSLIKQKQWRSEKYLKYVRTRPCVITGSTINVVAHHIRSLGGGGMGLKPADYYCVPLTAQEHTKLHSIGEKAYWREHNINPEDLVSMTILVFLAKYPSPELIEKLSPIVSTIA